MAELWRLGAGELAAMIAAKQVSSAEVVDAHLGRIAAVNPALNAVTRVLADEARAAAAAAEAMAALAQAQAEPSGETPAAADGDDEKDKKDKKDRAATAPITSNRPAPPEAG